MKKIILSFVLLLAVQGVQAQDCSTLKCPAPYDLTSGFSRGMSTVTGQKFLSEKIGEKLVKKAIKKNITSGDIKVNLDAYSVRDLKAGRFKSLEINGKNVDIQGVYISSFNAKTLCNFNYIANDKRGNYIVKEDIPASFNATITEEDLNKTMLSSDYKRMIDDINSIGGNLNIFQITSTNIKLKNDKMYYVLKYSMPFVRKTKELVITANLKVENGQIELANTSFLNNSMALDVDKLSKLINYINPLDFSAKILENKDAKFNIETVNISNGKITIDGNMTILKDKEQ
ncbi:unknown [Clostridium sp. CAG:715]|jgi:hypothetical protein|nr:unknown [Clostridium sp. CAG:715]DAA82371.1 MAG TPA: hypothetical protein CPT82_07035 [Candidatus Gastranaerophilales bacterium HUM_2]